MTDKSKPAAEAILNELHSIIAMTLKDQPQATMEVEDGDGNTNVVSMATPALIAQGIKFLKDNDITSVPEADENIEALKDILKKKQKRGSNVLSMSATQAASEE